MYEMTLLYKKEYRSTRIYKDKDKALEAGHAWKLLKRGNDYTIEKIDENQTVILDERDRVCEM